MEPIVKVGWAIAIGLFLLAAVLACATIRAADELPGKPVTTAAEAVGWALADLATIPEQDRPFVRYAWVPPWGNDKWVAAMDFAVNTAASQSSVIQLGTPIANGWMLRYDLRRLAPKRQQLDTLRSVWDGLASQDPFFHVPTVVSGNQAIIIAPHLAQQEAVALAGMSLSTGAIFRVDFLLTKMLSTLEGGKYYDFLQVQRQAKKENSTPQAEWLETLGVFEETTQNLSSDQRSAILRSNVTGKPRRIDAFYGLGRGANLVTITHDTADEDVAAAQHPIRNLIKFDDRAREIIVRRPNGTHAFVLTNDAGEFQDAAPDNVVRDFTVPPPHTSRLQPAISCIRCHGPHDGYQPFGNDVAKILSTQLDVFADTSSKEESRESVVDRLAGLYAGQLDAPDGPIGRGRRDYGATCYKIAREGTYQDIPSIAAALSDTVSTVFASYRYDVVTPDRACLELGLEVEPTKGIDGLNRLLGEPKPGVAVDPIAGTLRAGIAVNRSDFDAVYPDMALQVAVKKGWRSQQERQQAQQAKPKVEPKPEPKTEPKAAEPPKPDAIPVPAAAVDGAMSIHQLHNDARRKAGLPLLALSEQLSKVAQGYANFLYANQETAREVISAGDPKGHNLDGGNVQTRVNVSGYRWSLIGENIAWSGALSTETQVMDAWIKSEVHKRNIMGAFSEIGIGHAGPAWVVVYAARKK
jgi:uncharacterized protein YkwD